MQLKQVSDNCFAALKMKITANNHLIRAALVTASRGGDCGLAGRQPLERRHGQATEHRDHPR